MVVNSGETVRSTPCSSVFLPFSCRLKVLFWFPPVFLEQVGISEIGDLEKDRDSFQETGFPEGVAP